MEVRRRQDAKSVCIKRQHGAMSAGEFLEEELCLKAVALLCVVTGEDENEQEESDLLVVTALSKIDERVALLVRKLAKRFSVFTREGGICVSYVFASRVNSRFRSWTRPLNK